MNPLLGNNNFIPFNQFDLIQLDEAISNRLHVANDTLDSIVLLEENISWQMLADSFYPALYDLNQMWGITTHLQSVNDSKELRDLYNKFQPLITEFYTNLWQNTLLYHQFKHIKQTDYKNLDPEAQKIIDNELRDFFLGGIELSKENKTQFTLVEKELSVATTKFEQNLLDSTDSFVKYVERNELDDVPDDILLQYEEEAKADGKKSLYKITLQMPSYLPIMQYCSNRSLREELYYKYVTRASELSNKEFDNTEIIHKILKLRQEKAKILGFRDYNELSLYNKMANSSTQVLDFLRELAKKSKQQAENDITELTTFAKNICKLDTLEAWDIPYVSEKLQEKKYSYSNNELKQYFPLSTVLDGLFKLIFQLYQIEFKANNIIPTWHDKVKTYDVVAQDKIIGHLYCDLFARRSKQSGAWMNSAQDRFVYRDITKNPIAYIICNFTDPIKDQPCLLTFDDVQTLFHEMGHALHHLLTKINHFSISGINNVEWDAVELPSQFMEYFTWNYLILTTISRHVKSEAILPLELFDKLLSARHFQAGIQMLRQLEFAIFDILLHSNNNTKPEDYLALLDQVRSEVAVIFPPAYNRFPNSFSHIFAGGYAAGYYSYKWAQVLATDIFSIFDDVGMEEYANLGQKFLKTILSQGGLKPMLINFVDFMGRKPQLEALLKYSGIQNTIEKVDY